MGTFQLYADDPRYPDSLKHDPKSPGTVYGVGNASALTPGVAVIGARGATPYGLRASALVAEWVADAGLTVYSGAARGCDQAAHRAALAAGGKTVAVLGCGPDVVYPSGAASLLSEICKEGALVSPFEWGTPPAKYKFPIRNRMIAAFAALVVVTEAKVPSGTFSTVGAAIDFGIPVAAVPGSIFSRYADAPNRLIADGATVITRREDLYTALDMLCLTNGCRDDEPGPKFAGGSMGLTPLERRLLEMIAAQPLSVGALSLALATDPAALGGIAERLVISGRATRFADGTYMALG